MFLNSENPGPLAIFVFALAVWTPAIDVLAGEKLKALEQEIQKSIQLVQQSVVTVTSQFSQAVDNKNSGLPSSTSEHQAPPHTYINIGTGVIFDKDGFIVTRSSVVLGAKSNSITFANGVEAVAEYIGSDPETGFAVLHTAESALLPANFNNSEDLLPGSWTFMIGNSLGVYPSVVFGSVSSVREDGLLQLSTHLSPGNNGGPIINMAGEVVGIVAGKLNAPNEFYSGFSASDLAFAYPSNLVQQVAKSIIKYGQVKKGWLGVVGFSHSEKPQIREIKDNSPAQHAGLVTGDVILNYSNTNITSIDQLANLVESTQPGEIVHLEYLRGKQRLSTKVRLGEKLKQPQVWNDTVSHGQQASQKEMGPSHPQNLSNVIIMQRIEQLQLELTKLKMMVRQP